MKTVPVLYLLWLWPAIVFAQSAQTAAEPGPADTALLRVEVGSVQVDTAGLATASATLAQSVEQLAQSIERLSADDVNLDEAEKQQLMRAVASVEQASLALRQMAEQLPGVAEDLGERVPEVIASAHAPLAEITRSIESARASVAMMTDALPEVTENTNQLVNSAMDAALQRLILYTVALVAIIAIALILVIWFIYQQYLRPLTQKLDELVGAPEHFENMSRHMRDTSANLLQAEAALARQSRPGPRGASAYRRPV